MGRERLRIVLPGRQKMYSGSEGECVLSWGVGVKEELARCLPNGNRENDAFTQYNFIDYLLCFRWLENHWR